MTRDAVRFQLGCNSYFFGLKSLDGGIATSRYDPGDADHLRPGNVSLSVDWLWDVGVGQKLNRKADRSTALPFHKGCSNRRALQGRYDKTHDALLASDAESAS